MNIKAALLKDFLREIRRSKTRFLSILLIVAIGTGFFAGLKACAPDMHLTAEKYYADHHLMDLHLVSTLGIDEDNLRTIQDAGGIKDLYAGYSATLLYQNEDSESIVKVMSSNFSDEEINAPLLIEGRYPTAPDECVIDESGKYLPEDWVIGAEITLKAADGENIDDSMAEKTFTIVGSVRSPLYVNFERGNCTIGDGKIDTYILTLPEAFSYEIYTDVYLTLDALDGVPPFSEEYDDILETETDRFTKLSEELAKARYDALYEEGREELDEGIAEFNEEKEKGQKELDDAAAELADAKKELDDGFADYYQGLDELNTRIADAKATIQSEKETLENAKAELEQGYQTYQEQLAAFEQTKKDVGEQIAAYEVLIDQKSKEISAAYEAIDAQKALVEQIRAFLDSYADVSISDASLYPEDVKMLLSAASELDPSLSGLLASYLRAQPENKTAYRNGVETALEKIEEEISANEALLAQAEEELSPIREAVNSFYEGKAALQQAKETLDQNALQIEEGEAALLEAEETLAAEEAEGRAKLSDAYAQLMDGKAEYEDGLAEYQDGKATFDAEIADAQKELDDAEKELNKLALPVYYIWDRYNNPGYSDYQNDTLKVDAVAKVFPVFFVLVAGLVCLTTMSRMVDEQRTLIGTFKALGYSRRSIMIKYVGYAMFASLVGTFVGVAIGFRLFPTVVINAYRIMYVFPDPLMPFRWDYTIGCLIVAFLCTGVSAYFACRKALKSFPAQLMRPKTPKAGKRVIWERMPKIWNRIDFIQKVTLRNISRYKGRGAMTVIGVAGCTALILAGFGLRYSITSIGPKQYSEIFLYDAIVVTEEDLSQNEQEKVTEQLSDIDEVTSSMAVLQKNMDVQSGNAVKSITTMVISDPDQLGDYIVLKERLGGKEISWDENTVIITEKLARMLSLSEEDTFTINNPDGSRLTVTVGGITENYAMNFVYFTPSLYESLFGHEPAYNARLLNFEEGVDEEEMGAAFLETENVLGYSLSTEASKTFTEMMSSLDLIVWVIIFSAGALALIVMYKLVNISVNERIRELATIKVLGFYDKEVSAYIYRENTFYAVLGTLFGLILGIFLEKFVIQTAEVDAVMFSPEIPFYCFFFATVITLFFTVIVNVLLHFSLKKIDMVESLKSVE